MAIKKDDHEPTYVRAVDAYRGSDQEIVALRAKITRLEEERRAQASALYNRQTNHDYLLNSTVPWGMAFCIFVTSLPTLYNFFALPSFFVILTLMGLYTAAGIKSIFLGYGLDKTTHALRYRLSRICASERAQLTSVLISTILFVILSVAFSSIVLMILMCILPVMQGFVAVNIDRWRCALRDLRELDDVERKHEEIHRLRQKLTELGEEAPPPQEQLVPYIEALPYTVRVQNR